MKRVCFGGILVLVALPALTAVAITKSYEDKLEKGRYKGALLELNKKIRLSDKVDRGLLVRVLIEKARFYERYIGDYPQAMTLLEQAMTMDEIEPQQASTAGDDVRRLDNLIHSHGEETRLLRALADTPRRLSPDQQLASIDSLLTRKPNSPYLAQLSYYLGAAHMQNGSSRRAHAAFLRALEIKPALDLILPVGENLKKARSKWHWELGHGLAWVSALLLFSIFAPLFYLSRPWQRLGLRQMIGVAAVALVWTGSYELFARWICGGADVEAFRAGATIISTSPSYDIFGKVDALFLYGLVGVLGAFVIVTASSNLQRARLRLVLSLVSCLILFVSLTGIFYMRHCFGAELRATNGAGILGSYFSYETKNPSPQVVSNPAAFLGMKISKLDEQMKREFIKRHYQRALGTKGP